MIVDCAEVGRHN